MRRIVLAICLITSFASEAFAGELTAAQVREDLIFFRDVYSARERAYSSEERGQMEVWIAREIGQARALSRAQLALLFARGQAFTQNNHSYSEPFDQVEDFHTLPIAFWWFDEGLIITRAHPEFRHLIGARIVEIGEEPVARVMALVAPYIAGNAQYRRYRSPTWLRRLEVLRQIGVASDSTVRLLMEDSNGRRFVARLGASPEEDPAARSLTWRESIVPGRGDPPWPHATDALVNLPAHLQAPADFHYDLLDDGSLLYVRSNDLYNYDDARPIAGKVYDMFDVLSRRPEWPRDVIVDIRFNEGGDFFKVLQLAEGLVRMTEPGGRIYVISGRATNSAAIILTALLRAGARDRVKIVGEEMSDPPQFWSEGGVLRAPASGLPLRYTDGYHDWESGCSDRSACYWGAMLYGVQAGPLHPDIRVAQTYAKYAAGRDPELEAVLTDLNRHRRAQ